MKKFYYKLTDSPNFTDFMLAESKEEIKNILLEQLPSEASILSIMTEKEYKAKMRH